MNKITLFSLFGIVCIYNVSMMPMKKSVREIEYPVGYRKWTHVKTYNVLPKNPAFFDIGGYNNVYANDIAMEGFESGFFPNGSIIVSDVVEAVMDSLTIRAGKRGHIDVMERDSLRWNVGNGWSFDRFEGSTTKRMLNEPLKLKCMNCHSINKDMVFAEFYK